MWALIHLLLLLLMTRRGIAFLSTSAAAAAPAAPAVKHVNVASGLERGQVAVPRRHLERGRRGRLRLARRRAEKTGHARPVMAMGGAG